MASNFSAPNVRNVGSPTVVELWNGKKALTLPCVAELDCARLQVKSVRSDPDLSSPKAIFDCQGKIYVAGPDSYESACSLDREAVLILARQRSAPSKVSDLILERLTIIAQRYLELRETAEKIFANRVGWEEDLYQITKFVVHLLEFKTINPDSGGCCYKKKDRSSGKPFSLAIPGNRIYIHTKVVIHESNCKIITAAILVDNVASSPIVRIKPNKKILQEKNTPCFASWNIEVTAFEILHKAKKENVDLTGLLVPRDILKVAKKKEKLPGTPVVENVNVYVEMANYPNLNRYMALNCLSASQKVRLGCHISKALETLHKLGVYHRDLKPDNIVIDRDGNPRITDFGSAKIMSKAGNVLQAGTRGFHPPEIDRIWPHIETESIDFEAWDAWDLGTLLLILEKGCHPDFVLAQHKHGSLQFNQCLDGFYQAPMPALHSYAWIYRALLIKDPQQRMRISQARSYLQALCEN